MDKYIDFLVVDGDFVLDSAGYAKRVSDNESIGQDIRHMLIESGLILRLLGERSEDQRLAIINEIILAVEGDQRLEPGTVKVSSNEQSNEYNLTADTIDYATIDITI